MRLIIPISKMEPTAQDPLQTSKVHVSKPVSNDPSQTTSRFTRSPVVPSDSLETRFTHLNMQPQAEPMPSTFESSVNEQSNSGSMFGSAQPSSSLFDPFRTQQSGGASLFTGSRPQTSGTFGQSFGGFGSNTPMQGSAPSAPPPSFFSTQLQTGTGGATIQAPQAANFGALPNATSNPQHTSFFSPNTQPQSSMFTVPPQKPSQTSGFGPSSATSTQPFQFPSSHNTLQPGGLGCFSGLPSHNTFGSTLFGANPFGMANPCSPNWSNPSQLFGQCALPKPTVAKPQFSCNLTMTFETEDNPADITIILNSHHTFKVNRRLLSRFSPGFSANTSASTINIETPFEDAFVSVLMYATYNDTFIITRNCSKTENLLELYAAARTLWVDSTSQFASLLLNYLSSQRPFDGNIFNSNSQFSSYHAWNRDYIDYDFALNLLGGVQNRSWSVGVHLIDWLGEKNCNSEEEAEQLLETEDFKQVKKFWTLKLRYQRQEHWPLFHIVQSYPVTSSAINLRSLFLAQPV